VLVGAAAAGAIFGDNIGFWIGREAGFPLLLRYGSYIRITEPKIKLGQYLFLRHGGKVVFFGRFIAILRALAAFLAGVNCMSWRRFLLFNAAGGILWAAVCGFGGWYFGKEASRLAEPAAIGMASIAVVLLAVGFFYLRHHAAQLEARAEAALPGPVRRVRVRHDGQAP
jgi:membrane protein DedA with SNARE-associated domain